MSRLNSRRIGSGIKQNQSQPFMKNTYDAGNLGLESYSPHSGQLPQMQQPYSMEQAVQNHNSRLNTEIQNKNVKSLNSVSLRLNVVSKENSSERISIISDSGCSISQLKRKIESEFYELHNKSILIKVIEDSRGFIFSNNSLIGDHVENNETIYFDVHKQKEGSNMNLPQNLTDIFMTLRYVTKSVIRKLSQVQNNMLSLRQILSELVHIGFWYSNTELVTDFLQLLNKLLTKQQLVILQKSSGEMLDSLMIKFVHFWLTEIPNTMLNYPALGQELLLFIEKLCLSTHYCTILKNNKVLKRVTDISKMDNLGQNLKKVCLNVIRASNGRNRLSQNNPSLNKLGQGYVPSLLQESIAQYSLEETLRMLHDQEDESGRFRALELFANKGNKLIVESQIRLDYSLKLLTGMINFRPISDQKAMKFMALIFEELSTMVTPSRSVQLLEKGILKKIHDFLLQSPVILHRSVNKYIERVIYLAAKHGELSVKKVCQLFTSPYEDFLVILVEGILLNSESQKNNLKQKGIVAAVYINHIKDFIKTTLKTQSVRVSTVLLKLLSNLCLEQQCRYQILNLKGIEIFVKFLESTQSDTETLKVCAKGLLNLAISSREIKARVLSQMTTVLQMYYKSYFDSVTNGYIETILKTTKM